MENCKINIEAWPPWAKEVLARDTLAAVKRFIAQPGGKEYLDRKISERQASETVNAEGEGT